MQSHSPYLQRQAIMNLKKKEKKNLLQKALKAKTE